MMKRLFLVLVGIFIMSSSFGLDIWLTLDPSQEQQLKQHVSKYFPQANIRVFYWDTALPQITKLIKHKKYPDILLTGHTFVPFIAQYTSSFSRVDPLFWDVRALYVWGKDPQLPINDWANTLYYIQTHQQFIAFPNEWTPDSFYNFQSFFNDQLPFWISQTNLSPQSMAYTAKLLTTLKRVYPALFTDKPVDAFLHKDNFAIISGVWMFDLLKKQKDPFSVFPVPESQNGSREFKGAYVAICFGDQLKQKSARLIMNSYKFQKDIWPVIQMLPNNPQLQKEIAIDPQIATLLEITKSTKWASTVEPKILADRIKVLNMILQNKKMQKDFNEQKALRLFANKLYVMWSKWFN
jgi:hypothetical protein